MRAVLPRQLRVLQQPQIDVVDERGRLQRLTRPLATHVARRQTPELVVDQRHQRRQRRSSPPRALSTSASTSGVLSVIGHQHEGIIGAAGPLDGSFR